MKREELIAKLDLVSPALATKEIVPIFSHLWFTGSRLMAYNDRIAISTPLKTDFKGAVPGALMINLLKASRAEEVTLTTTSGEMAIKAASMNAKLAIMPADDFNSIFTMPKPVQGALKPLSENFMSALAGCMRSVSSDTSVPDQLGVTMIPTGDRLSMYATDAKSLSYVTLKATLSVKSRAILPAAFCEQLITLAKDHEARLEVNDREGFALATVDDIILFGRLIDSPKPLNFSRIINDHVPSDAKKKLVPIPDKLESILDRAIVITEADGSPTEISVRDGGAKMDFYCRSDHGHEMRDVMTVDKHPTVKTRMDARLLRAGLGSFEDMLITDRCTIMNKGEAYYLVAARR